LLLKEQSLNDVAKKLTSFDGLPKKTDEVSLFTEKNFTFSLGQLKINGTYDLIVKNGDDITIKEFKTHLKGDQASQSLQLKIYTLAYKITTGKLPNLAVLESISSGYISSFVPDENMIDETQKLIIRVHEEIRKGLFIPHPSESTCRGCPFQELCHLIFCIYTSF